MCRSSQKYINCMRKNTTYILIFVLLINPVRLTTFSPLPFAYLWKRVHRRWDHFGATKWSYKMNHCLWALWDNGWCRDLCKQAYLGTLPVLCHLAILLLNQLASNSFSWLSIEYFLGGGVRYPKRNEMENSEARFLNDNYINFNNVFTFHKWVLMEK